MLPTLACTSVCCLPGADFHTPAYSDRTPPAASFGIVLCGDECDRCAQRTWRSLRCADAALRLAAHSGARAAWAHDFVNNPSLKPTFQSLPGGSFTVNGAQIAHEFRADGRLALNCSYSRAGRCSPKSTASSPPARRLTPAPARCAIRGKSATQALPPAQPAKTSDARPSKISRPHRDTYHVLSAGSSAAKRRLDTDGVFSPAWFLAEYRSRERRNARSSHRCHCVAP